MPSPTPTSPVRALILGGTTEASALARLLAGRADVAPTLSYAGRTVAPAAPPIPWRVGGFGGADGLARYLAEEGIEAVVDATHPFAVRISANAVVACRAAGVPLAVLSRPAWAPVPGDRWTEVDDAAAAAEALGPDPLRVFLTVGRLELDAFAAAPHHDYLVRTVDPPDPPPALPRLHLIQARGPFDAAAEDALLHAHGIEAVVTKNSGGGATYGKIAAARALGLPVVLIRRPAVATGVERLDDPAAALDWILRTADRRDGSGHHSASTRRGV